MDVKNFNPYKENKTAEEETIALTAEKVALQIHTTISTIQASGVSGGLDNDEAFSTALETVVEVVENYCNWLSSSELPKLFINADPGSILTGKQREFCRLWPNQEEVTVKGTHFIQEDSPDEIGKAVSNFVSKLRGN